MSPIKILGLAAIAAMALMAFAGTASATTTTSPAGTTYTGQVTATAESTQIVRPSFSTFTCTESQVKATSNAQSDSTTDTAAISTLTFGSCNSTVNVIAKGSLEIHAIGTGPNGTVTGKGTEITFFALGLSCVYGTSAAGTDLGTLTGSATTGTTATIDISTELPKIAGGILCSASAPWEGKYKVTEPDFLNIS